MTATASYKQELAESLYKKSKKQNPKSSKCSMEHFYSKLATACTVLFPSLMQTSPVLQGLALYATDVLS